jgi:hypothetical protein
MHVQDQDLHHPFPLAIKTFVEPNLKYGALNSIDDVTHVHVRFKFNQIARKNNRLQPFSALSAFSIWPILSYLAKFN